MSAATEINYFKSLLANVDFFMTLDQLLYMLPPGCHQTEALHSTEPVCQFFLCYPFLTPILLLTFFSAFKF